MTTKGYNDLDKMARLQALQLQALCAIARKLDVDSNTVNALAVEAEVTLRRLEEQARRRIELEPHVWKQD